MIVLGLRRGMAFQECGPSGVCVGCVKIQVLDWLILCNRLLNFLSVLGLRFKTDTNPGVFPPPLWKALLIRFPEVERAR